ncbi:MAG: nitrate/nitrite transporter [Spirochaetales bacterium]
MPDPDLLAVPSTQRSRALWLSTIAFTTCFAVWTIFSVIGVQVKKDLGLSEFQFGLLVGTPILTGSLIRLVLGIWADQVGGRIVYVGVMLAGAVATWLLTFATDYTSFLIAALGVGIAGGSFAVGITYVSQWYPKAKQGLPLGIFGAGNVGSAVTKLLAPVVMVAFGWKSVALIWAGALVVMAIVFWFGTTDDPHLVQRRAEGRKANKTASLLEPLKNLQVWRFSLYYFFAFGGFVALALWLPHYFNAVYGLPIIVAGMLGAAYSIPGSLFRVLGGYLSDKLGARRVMYWMFFGALASLFFLAYPAMSYHIDGIHGPIDFKLALDFVSFTVLIFVLGFFMSLGKAAVYKHIPVYYPEHVGPVGGVVGLMGGLGGWLFPILFGLLNDLTGVWTSCFMLLFAIAGLSLLWMHLAIRASEKLANPGLGAGADLPELAAVAHPAGTASLGARILGVAPSRRTQD